MEREEMKKNGGKERKAVSIWIQQELCEDAKT